MASKLLGVICQDILKMMQDLSSVQFLTLSNPYITFNDSNTPAPWQTNYHNPPPTLELINAQVSRAQNYNTDKPHH